MAKPRSTREAQAPIGEEPTETELEEAEAAEQEPSVEEQAEIEDAAEDLLIQAHQTYLQAVFEHFGPEAPVHPCPTCKTLGYVEVALMPDPNVHACEACGGLGITATGSLVDGNATRPCPACHGAGFVEEFGQPQVGQVGEAAPPVEPLPAESFPVPVVTPLAVGEVA